MRPLRRLLPAPVSMPALVSMLALVVSPAALAQDDGPLVDPDSPAGTEYQLPTDHARTQAGRGSKGTASGADGAADEAPLFGAGIEDRTSDAKPKPSSQTTSRSRKTPRGSGSKSGSGSAPARATGAAPDRETTRETIRGQASAPGGGGGLVAIGGGAAAVLLLGGVAGLAWRRRTMRR